jgi:predicted nucleotidyltransferase
MRERTEVRDQLRDMMAELRGQYHVKKIGIFGSFSQGRQTEQSDVDLVVEFDQPIGMMAFAHLRNVIADRLGIRVDLVTPDGLHPLIRDRVMREVVYV